MSLEKIQLPNFLLADLFKNTLVEIAEKEDIIPISNETISIQNNTPNTSFINDKKWYLGDNKKKITIVVNDVEAVFLKDEWLQFLTNILGACKLNMGDVAIVNFAQTPINFTTLQETTQPAFLIVFDVAIKDLQIPFTIPNYQVQTFNNCNFLSAPSLGVMLGEGEIVKAEKTKLWMSLKKLFNI